MVAFECVCVCVLTVLGDFGFDVYPLPLPQRFGVLGACLVFGSEGLGVDLRLENKVMFQQISYRTS